MGVVSGFAQTARARCHPVSENPSPLGIAAVAQVGRLRAALRDTKVSRLDLAKAMEDETATANRVKNTKRQIVRWLGEQSGISDANAERIAHGFRRLGHEYDDDYFKKERSPRPASYHEELQQLRAELDALRAKDEERHRELLAEIRELKEASNG
jgi:hypothetical protein